jgi:hypothetical protein
MDNIVMHKFSVGQKTHPEGAHSAAAGEYEIRRFFAASIRISHKA